MSFQDATPLSTHANTIDFSTFASLFPQKPKPQKCVSSQKRLSSFFKPASVHQNSLKLPFSRIPRAIPKNSGSIPVISCSSEAMKHWIFLAVKSIRRYQLEIVEIALFYNTLVCLPTGLGKTFIASIVILNYFLWFPTGKIFFLAPTRPLVHQQKQALYDLKSIPWKHVVEITGGISSEKRHEFYLNPDKRVFFMTPQTLENDMKEKKFDLCQIVLIIFDEAHRATGDYAYTGIIKILDQGGFAFRVLALSASPGNNLEQVQEVLNNLMINKLELREESDPDVKPYLFLKEVMPCVIKKNESIEELSIKLEELIISHFRKITAVNDVMGDKTFCYKIRELNRGYFMDIFERFRKKTTELYAKYGKSRFFDEKCLIVLEYMSRMYELFAVVSSIFYGKSLIATQGIQSFQIFLQKFEKNLSTNVGTENQTKKELLASESYHEIKRLLSEICLKNTAHPKLAKLKELLSDYFNSFDTIKNNSKAIIFTQSRNTAREISLFINENPKILSAIFIGQAGRISNRRKEEEKDLASKKHSKRLDFLDKYITKDQDELTKPDCSKSEDILPNNEKNEKTRAPNSNNNEESTKKHKCPGMSQKEQIQTIQSFKAGKLNTLIATCIGEEGLDIGDVDLIICYDSGFSPIRMIQRKGRTGRHRDGKVIVLLMEGKELNAYLQNVKKSEGLIKSLKKCSMYYQEAGAKTKGKKELKFYPFNPRMLPEEENPILLLRDPLLREEDLGKEADEEVKKRKYTRKKQCFGSNEQSTEGMKETEKEGEVKDKGSFREKRKYVRRKIKDPKKEEYEGNLERKKRTYVKRKKKEEDSIALEVSLLDGNEKRSEIALEVSLLDGNEKRSEREDSENEKDEACSEQNSTIINKEEDFKKSLLENTRDTIDSERELENQILEADSENEEGNYQKVEREIEELAMCANEKSEHFSKNSLDNETIDSRKNNESFDSSLDKAINEIVGEIENVCEVGEEVKENEGENEIDVVDRLLHEFEKNEKKRKISMDSIEIGEKRLKYEEKKSKILF